MCACIKGIWGLSSSYDISIISICIREPALQTSDILVNRCDLSVATCISGGSDSGCHFTNNETIFMVRVISSFRSSWKGNISIPGWTLSRWENILI